jgi:MFS family permease
MVRPGIIYLLSFFYMRHEVGFRCGLFASAAPLASTFAGALAYGITGGHSHLRSWRLLFLVEGLATVIMAPIAYYFIPDSPDKARFLNAEDREVVKSRVMRQVGMSEGVRRVGGLNLKEFALTLIDYKAWFVAVREPRATF